MGPDSEWRHALTPGHEEKGEAFAEDAGVSKPMKENLYYATLCVMYCGASTKELRDSTGGRFSYGRDDLRAALKEWFERRFRASYNPTPK
jgi:hypothetical protein